MDPGLWGIPPQDGKFKGPDKLEKVEAIPIELPNGMMRLAKLQGAVNLGSRITLSNILYIPDFHCNLISIA